MSGLRYRNWWACCICHRSDRNLVLHHIDPWEHSHSHDVSNLAVLCLDHHGEAHTTRELGRNLTADRIRAAKQKWEKQVAAAATKALFASKSVSLNGAMWDYFNRVRIDHVLTELQIHPSSSSGLPLNVGDETARQQLHYRSEGRHRSQNADEYAFYASALRAICQKKEWLDLKRIWSGTEILQLVQPGMLMALTANHRFRSSDRDDLRGPGQTRDCYHRASGVSLEFTFDAWECTSNSAYTSNLRGQWICTSLCIARSVSYEQGRVVIAATCLGIGTGFTEYSGSKPAIAWIKEEYREPENPDF